MKPVLFAIALLFVLRITYIDVGMNSMHTYKSHSSFDSKKGAVIDAWRTRFTPVSGYELFEIDLDKGTIKEISIPDMPE